MQIAAVATCGNLHHTLLALVGAAFVGGVVGGCSGVGLVVSPLDADGVVDGGADLIKSGEPPWSSCPPSPAGAPIAVTQPDSIASASDRLTCDAAAFAIFPWKNGAAGAPCAGPLDCAPICCACSVAGRSALVSWCNAGACADPASTCCALLGTPTRSCGLR